MDVQIREQQLIDEVTDLRQRIAELESLEAERVRTEEALRGSEERYRLLVDNAPIGILSADVEGNILAVNPAILKTLGSPSAEATRAINLLTFPPLVEAGISADFHSCLLNGEPIVAQRFYQSKWGKPIDIRYHLTPTRETSGKVVGLQAVIEDVTERVQAEKALRESEERFVKAFHSGPNLMAIIRMADGHIVNVNDSFVRVVGYSREELIGRGTVEMGLWAIPEERDMFTNALRENKRVNNLVMQLRKKSGDLRTVLLSGEIVNLNGERHLITVANDITERKQAERALLHRDARLQSFYDNAAIGIAIATTKGNYIQVNNHYLEMFGYVSEEELFRKSVGEVSHPDDRLTTRDAQMALAAGEIDFFRDEKRYLRKDGSYFWGEVSVSPIKEPDGKINALTAVITDISERKRAEQLQEAVYRISQATNHAPSLEDLFAEIHEIVQGVMPANNFYIALYDEEERLLHFPYIVDEVEQVPVPPDKPGKGLTANVLRNGKSLLCDLALHDELLRSGEVELLGTQAAIWLGVPLTIENKVIGVMVVQHYSDVKAYGEREQRMLEFVSSQVANAIDHKQAEERLKAALAEKELLLREIHHRVKNNMQVISSLLDIQAGQIQDEQARKLIWESQSRVRSMALVHEKLYQDPNLMQVDFADYVQGLAKHLFSMHYIDPEIIKFRVDVKDVYLGIDTAIPCGLVINELISNSLKYAFPEGNSGEVRVELRREGELYCLSVSDDGVGMPEGLDWRETETLGLQLIDTLTRQLKGEARLDRNGGTTFMITFPPGKKT